MNPKMQGGGRLWIRLFPCYLESVHLVAPHGHDPGNHIKVGCLPREASREAEAQGHRPELSSAVMWERTGCRESKLWNSGGEVVWMQPWPSGPHGSAAHLEPSSCMGICLLIPTHLDRVEPQPPTGVLGPESLHWDLSAVGRRKQLSGPWCQARMHSV